MVWWSPTILGGEPISDIRDDLQYKLGLPKDRPWDADVALLKERLALRPLDWYLRVIRDASDPHLAAQVVALAHMAAGAPLAAPLRDMAINACVHLSGRHADTFGSEQRCAVRRAELAALRTLLMNYDGQTPTRPREETVFQLVVDQVPGRGSAPRRPRHG